MKNIIREEKNIEWSVTTILREKKADIGKKTEPAKVYLFFLFFSLSKKNLENNKEKQLW